MRCVQRVMCYGNFRSFFTGIHPFFKPLAVFGFFVEDFCCAACIGISMSRMQRVDCFYEVSWTDFVLVPFFRLCYFLCLFIKIFSDFRSKAITVCAVFRLYNFGYLSRTEVVAVWLFSPRLLACFFICLYFSNLFIFNIFYIGWDWYRFVLSIFFNFCFYYSTELRIFYSPRWIIPHILPLIHFKLSNGAGLRTTNLLFS